MLFCKYGVPDAVLSIVDLGQGLTIFYLLSVSKQVKLLECLPVVDFSPD